MSQESPALPLDILEHIIDLLAHRADCSDKEAIVALRICSLSHRSFLHFSRKHIFRKISINTCLSVTNHEARVARELVDLLFATPIIGGYVRSLKLSICRDAQQEYKPYLAGYPHFFSMFQHFTNLQELTLHDACRVDHVARTWISVECDDIVKTLIQSDTLVTLEVVSVKLPLLNMTPIGANLRCLHLWKVEIPDNMAMTSPSMDSDGQQLVQLEEYTMGTYSATSTKTILKLATPSSTSQQIFNFSHLSRLRAILLEEEELNIVLDMVQMTTCLTKIDIDLSHVKGVGIIGHWSPDLSALFEALLPSVSTLESIKLNRAAEKAGDLLLGLPHHLNKISHLPNVLEEFTIEIWAYTAEACQNIVSECSMLDAVLGASTSWPCLKTVYLEIVYNKDQPPSRPKFPLLSASETVSFSFLFYERIYSI